MNKATSEAYTPNEIWWDENIAIEGVKDDTRKIIWTTLQTGEWKPWLQLEDMQRIRRYLKDTEHYLDIIDILYNSANPTHAKDQFAKEFWYVNTRMKDAFIAEEHLTNNYFWEVLATLNQITQKNKPFITIKPEFVYRALAHGIVRHTTLNRTELLSILKKFIPQTDFAQLQKFVEEIAENLPSKPSLAGAKYF